MFRSTSCSYAFYLSMHYNSVENIIFHNLSVILQESKNVILIFSVKESGKFQGNVYAKHEDEVS